MIEIQLIEENKLISMCELQIGVYELSKDISLNNMWGFTFQKLSKLEKELESHGETRLLNNKLPR